MKTRKHHNNKGQRQIRTGRTAEQVKRMAERLGIVWSPQSHLGALTDRPGPASGNIVPGKSRRLKRKE